MLVCLIRTTIGGLLSAIGIAGMDRTTASRKMIVRPASRMLSAISFAFSGARLLRRDPFDHFAVSGNELAGGNQDQIACAEGRTHDGFGASVIAQTPRRRFGSGPAEGVGLRLAAACFAFARLRRRARRPSA